MKTQLKYISILFISLLLIQLDSISQTVNKFGIKGALILSKLTMSDLNSDVISHSPSDKFKFLSIDAGIFVEFFDSRYFCISTELHYKISGEEDDNYFTVLYPEKTGEIENYSFRHLSDRFHSLSLQILPRWKYIVNSEDKLYIFAGPRVDFRLSNYNARFDDAVEFKNLKVQAGFTAGIGNEIWDFLSLEVRYEYSFTNAYTIIYGDQEMNRKNSSFLLLAGISLKKLLRINL